MNSETELRMVVDTLDIDTCTQLLARGGIGRIGFLAADGVVVLPVNFAFDLGRVVFRTSTGSKYEAAMHRARVAFEVDGRQEDGTYWSVVLKGVAQEVWDPVELRNIDRLPLWSLVNHDHGTVVEIAPAEITGRRFRHIDAAPTLGRQPHAGG